jgi:hypothetical protein
VCVSTPGRPPIVPSRLPDVMEREMSANDKPDFGAALTLGRTLDLKLPTAAPSATPTTRHRLNRRPGFSTM